MIAPLLALALIAPAQAAEAPTFVDPATLAGRADLVGKEVLVDDRLVHFQFHRNQGYDEVVLRRAGGVTFRLPPPLRPTQPPRASGARVRGVVRRERDATVVDVTRLELLPDDLERVEQAVKPLPPGEFEKRGAWGRWARERARLYRDEPNSEALNTRLEARGKQLEAQALRAEADRPGAGDRADFLLGLARKGRARGLDGLEPAALAHAGFRARLGREGEPADPEATAAQILELLPDAARPDHLDLDPWLDAYREDPAAAYRAAPREVRVALDRRLYTDAVAEGYDRRSAGDPASTIDLAQEARVEIPDRPDVSSRLLDRGTAAALDAAGTLRRAALDELADRLRDELGRPEQARELRRRWLDHQRAELNPGDAEGRVAFAELYRRWLGDDRSAATLLADALKIDPKSSQANDMFRRMGYRRMEGRWVEPGGGVAKADETSSEPVAGERGGGGGSGGGLIERDMTREQVRARMGGKPDRIARVATQGQVVEQWTYISGKSRQVINFRVQPGRLQPTVSHYYSLR